MSGPARPRRGRPGRRQPGGRPRRAARLERGEAIAALAGAALLATTFLDWYGSELAGQARRIKLGGGAGAGGDAWDSLDLLPWLLLLAALVALATAVLALRRSRWRPAVPLDAAVAVLGGAATLWVALRILFPPGFGELGGVAVNATVELGAYLGLAAAAGVAYGGYRALGERGTSFARIADELSRDRGRERGGAGRGTKGARSGP
ncbi:MAG: hypothetical protein U0R71_11600 [Solirubrobacterales bacterium]